MGFYVSDTVIDVKLQYIKDNCTKVVVLDADPVGVYSDAVTANGTGDGKMIAEVTVDSTDFTIANAELGTGRQVKCAAQSSVAATAAGDATYLAWLDVTGTEILVAMELSATRTGISVSDPLDIPATIYDSPDAVEAT